MREFAYFQAKLWKPMYPNRSPTLTIFAPSDFPSQLMTGVFRLKPLHLHPHREVLGMG
jgi:hypothetical protein